jgi:RimJ/RimL family protein N-acetyltransferase
MITRILTDSDAAGFHHVRRRALQEEPEAFSMMPEEMASVAALAERFKGEWSGQHGFVMGAFDSDLIGIVGCVREPRVKRLHVALIWGMYVVPEHRGRSLGRRLLLDAIAQAEKWPELEQLWLDVTTTNLAARMLYLSCGFQVIGVRPRALKIADRYYDEEIMALQTRR